MIKRYILKLSNKVEIPVDEDEVQKIKSAINSGDIVQIRQGLFNPSYFVALIEGEENRNPLPDIFSNIKQLK